MNDNKDNLKAEVACLKAFITLGNKYKTKVKMNDNKEEINSEEAWKIYVDGTKDKVDNWSSFQTFSEISDFILNSNQCFFTNRNVMRYMMNVEEYRYNKGYLSVVENLFNTRKLVLSLTNIKGNVRGVFGIKPTFRMIKSKSRNKNKVSLKGRENREAYLKSNKQNKLKLCNKVKSFSYNLVNLTDMHLYYNLNNALELLEENEVLYVTLDYASSFILEALGCSNVVGCNCQDALIYLLKTYPKLTAVSKIIVVTSNYFDIEKQISLVETFPANVEFIPLQYGETLLEIFNKEGEYGIRNTLLNALSIDDYILNRFVNNDSRINSRAYYLCAIASYSIWNSYKQDNSLKSITIDKIILDNKYLIEKFLSYSKLERSFFIQTIELLLAYEEINEASATLLSEEAKGTCNNKVKKLISISYVEIVEAMMRSKALNLDKELVTKQLYSMISTSLKNHLTNLNKPEHNKAIEEIILKDKSFNSSDYIDTLYLLSRNINDFYSRNKSAETIDKNKFLNEFPIYKSLLEMVDNQISYIEIKSRGIKKQFQMNLNNIILYSEIISCKRKLRDGIELLSCIN